MYFEATYCPRIGFFLACVSPNTEGKYTNIMAADDVIVLHLEKR